MSRSVNSSQQKPLLSNKDSPPSDVRNGEDGVIQATVSTLTKTPWGDMVSHKSVRISRPNPPDPKLKVELSGKTTSSSETRPPAGVARTSPRPKPPPPGGKPVSRPKPNPVGPKPVVPGSQPKLPGTKPKLPGPKPKLPGPKPNLPGPKPNFPGPKSNVPGPKPKLPMAPKPPPKQQVTKKELSPDVPHSHRKEDTPTSDDEWVVIESLVNSPRFPRSSQVMEKQTSFPFSGNTKPPTNGSAAPRTAGQPSPSPSPGSPHKKPLMPPAGSGSPSHLSTAPSARNGEGPTTSLQSGGSPLLPARSGGSPLLPARSRESPLLPARNGGSSPGVKTQADVLCQPQGSAPEVTSNARSDSRASTLPLISEQTKSVPSSSSPSVYVDDFEEQEQRRTRLGAMGRMTRETKRKIGGSFEQIYHEQEDLHSVEVQRLSLNLSVDSSDESPRGSPSVSMPEVSTSILADHPLLTKLHSPPPPATREPVNPDASPSKPDLSPEERAEKHRNKRYNIAKELRDTEERYVSRLKLVAVDFYEAISAVNSDKKTVVPDSALHQIFLNIKPIYQFSTELLSELDRMLELWQESECLGKVLSRLAPFLKLYSQYTSKFHSAMESMTAWAKKERRFDAALKQFEQSPACGGLSVAHHMLEPVQRIPRYRLLLADYLKYLPEDSPDYKPAEKALAVISEAADAANNRIKDLERLSEILAIQRALQEYDEPLVAPGRILIKKGRLNKFSRKTTQQRAFFLFSDMLIHATISGGGGYKCRDVMPIVGMEVSTPQVSPVPFTFTVVSTTRSLTLAASTEEEKQEWYEVLLKVIQDANNKFKSLKKTNSLAVNVDVPQDTQFGVKAPVWLPDDSVSMCMMCCAEFKLTFRRHHCRACGKVICNNCFKYKVYLRYKGKEDKVCEGCFQEAKKQGLVTQEGIVEQEETDGDPQTRSTVLDVKAVDADTVIANYLVLVQGGGKARFWFQLKRDCVLYRFKAHEDIRAIESIPLPGYDIQKEGCNTLVLSQVTSVRGASKSKRETHRLRVEEGDVDMWMVLLRKASSLELATAASS